MTTRKYLDDNQVDRLSAAFMAWHLEKPLTRARYLAAFLLIKHTGARISEALAVRSADLDPSTRAVTLTTLKQKRGKKLTRTVRLPPEVFARILELRALASGKRKEPRVTYRVFHRIYKEVATRAGVDVAWATPHTMRHSCAIRLLKRGIGVEVVQRRLGHASITSTMIYTQLTAEDVENIIESAGAL